MRRAVPLDSLPVADLEQRVDRELAQLEVVVTDRAERELPLAFVEPLPTRDGVGLDQRQHAVHPRADVAHAMAAAHCERLLRVSACDGAVTPAKRDHRAQGKELGFEALRADGANERDHVSDSRSACS